MANKHRGEIDIELSGRIYTLRPTFQSLCEIENSLNKSIIDILEGLLDTRLKLQEISKIIYHTAKGYDKCFALTEAQIGEEILKTGVIKVMPQILKLLEVGVGINL